MGNSYYFQPFKYGNRKVTVDGVTFASKREAGRYQELRLLERAKQISDLRLQVTFELIPKQKDPETGEVIHAIKYIADFVYKDENGREIVEDAKGYRTSDFVIKQKLMLYMKGIKVHEV